MPGPFLTETTTLSYDLPQHVVDVLVDEDPTVVSRHDRDVACLHGRTARPARAPRTGVPWIWSPACLGLHDWTEHLAAKGMVVVHVAYPSHLIMKGRRSPSYQADARITPTCPQDGRHGRRHGRP